MKYCDYCHTPNPDEADRCRECGHVFPRRAEARDRDSAKQASLAAGGLPDRSSALAGLEAGSVLANRYQIVRLIGRGTMGTVYLARERTLTRDIALKVLPPAVNGDPSAIALLKKDVRLASSLKHPNLVEMYLLEEAQGLSFIAMEYVEGEPLTQWLASGTTAQRIEGFERFANSLLSAISHAHSFDPKRAVVHQDIRPSNILIRDSDRTLAIADFGISETLRNATASAAGGSLLYMAPELMRGEHATAATDQYAVGCTLYEVLSGHPPFCRGAIESIIHQISSHEPQPTADVPDHINAAISRSLAKNPADRWPDLSSFGEALRNERPVEVDIANTPWDLRKAVLSLPADLGATMAKLKASLPDRTKVPPRAIAAMIVALLVAVSALLWLIPADVSVVVKTAPDGAVVYVDGSTVGSRTPVVVDMATGRRRVQLALGGHTPYDTTIVVRDGFMELGPVGLRPRYGTVFVRSEPQRARVWWDGTEQNGVTPVQIDSVPSGQHRVRIVKEGHVELTADIATGGAAGAIRHFELEGGAVLFRERWARETYRDSVVGAETVADLADSVRAAIASDDWDAATQLNAELRALNSDSADRFSSRIGEGRQAEERERAESEERARAAREKLAEVRQLKARAERAIRLRNWGNAEEAANQLAQMEASEARTIGRAIRRAKASRAQQLQSRVPDAWRGRQRSSLDAMLGELRTLGHDDESVRGYAKLPGDQLETLQGNRSYALSVCITPDGRQLVSGDADGAVRVWSLSQRKIVRILTGHTGPVRSVAVDDSGRYTLSCSDDMTVRVWETSDGAPVKVLTGHTDKVLAVSASPDGRYVLSGGADRTVRIWSTRDWRHVGTISDHAGPVRSVVASPDGRHLVTASEDSMVRIFAVGVRRAQRVLSGHRGPVHSVAVSPDGRHIVSGSTDSTVKVWDFATGASRKTLIGHTSYVYSVAVSPDGQYIVSASADNTGRLWHLTDGAEVAELKGHAGVVSSVAVSPDGRTIVTGGFDSTVRTWRGTAP